MMYGANLNNLQVYIISIMTTNKLLLIILFQERSLHTLINNIIYVIKIDCINFLHIKISLISKFKLFNSTKCRINNVFK